MSIKLGMNGKLYRNTGTYEAPAWEEIANAKDVTLSLETGEADVTTRANNGWKASKATLKDGSVEFEMVWDTEDEGSARSRPRSSPTRASSWPSWTATSRPRGRRGSGRPFRSRSSTGASRSRRP